MGIKIRLNYAFQPYASNREIVEVSGNTIKECLDNLIELFPVFKEILFDNEGRLSALVLLKGETVIPDDLNHPMVRGELLLTPMIQGG
jgi:hypothetical protein